MSWPEASVLIALIAGVCYLLHDFSFDIKFKDDQEEKERHE